MSSDGPETTHLFTKTEEEHLIKVEHDTNSHNMQYTDEQMYNIDKKPVESPPDHLTNIGSQQRSRDAHQSTGHKECPGIYDHFFKKEELTMDSDVVDMNTFAPLQTSEISSGHVDAKYSIFSDEPEQSYMYNVRCSLLSVDKSVYRCGKCSYQTSIKLALIHHVNSHIIDTTSDTVYSHVNREHSIPKMCPFEITALRKQTHCSGKPFLCEICGYRATLNTTLIQHIRTHTGEKPFKCEMCDYRASQRGSLAVHVRIHTGEKPFKCAICSYRTSQKHLLLRHIKSQSGEKLGRHIRSHTGEKPFKCKMCNFRASQKANLVQHIRTHTGEKPFKCKICDYSFSRSSYLTLHTVIHSGAKPFRCEICEYRATFKSSLIDHIKTHTGEKPFKCNICDYKASRNSTLLDHIRTHTGEKPFNCEICDYRASRNSTLVKHTRTHTGAKP